MANEAFSFYQADGAITVEVITGSRGRVTRDEVLVPNQGVYMGDAPQDRWDRLGENTEEFYSSARTRAVEVGGQEYKFEIASIQKGRQSSGAELRSATFSSGPDNLGNGFEVASWATHNPNRAYIYVGSPAKGESTPMTSAERKYFAKTGSLLYEDDGKIQALPYVKALGKVLFDNDLDLQITRLGSDSAGALLTTSYGAVFGKGNIESSHQNARTGIKDKAVLGMAKAAFYDNGKVAKPHAENSPDALKMRDELIEFAKEHGGQDFLDRHKGGTSLAMLGAYARGLRLGPRHGDPLVRDNKALLRENPEASILFTVGDMDAFSSRPDLDTRMTEIVRHVSIAGSAAVRAVVVSGAGHDFQTHEPQFLQAIDSAILG